MTWQAERVVEALAVRARDWSARGRAWLAGGAPGHRRLFVQVTVVLALWLVAWFAVAWLAPQYGYYDLRIYRNAMRYWITSGPIYGYTQPHTYGLGFTYPPFAALCMIPMVLLDWETTKFFSSVWFYAALVLTTCWLMIPLARRRGWPIWFTVAVALPFIFALEPIWETLGFGQVNLLLAALILLDFLVLMPRGSRWTGVGIGLATAIKLVPAVFIVYLWITGRRRAAGVALGAAGGATLLGWAVDPAMSWMYWGDLVWDSSRVAPFPDRGSNQSLLGLIARLADPSAPPRLVWLVLVIPIAAFGLWRARRAALAGDELTGMTLAGLTSVLASPVSWTHHLYWVVPALVVFLWAALDAPRGSSRRHWLFGALFVTYAVFASALVRVYEHAQGGHYSEGLIGVLGENSQVIMMLALLAILPIRSRVAPGAEPGVSSGALTADLADFSVLPARSSAKISG